MKIKLFGFFTIEVIIAIVIVFVIVSVVVTTGISSIDSSRLSKENFVASQYAQFGIEGARSVRNQSFQNLTNTTGIGLSYADNGYILSGTGNTFDKYNLKISISDVFRDGSGNITASGMLDPDIKKITSAVTWNFNSTRQSSISLSTYLSKWPETFYSYKGLLAFGDGGTSSDSIKYRIFDPATNTWGSVLDAADVDTGSSNRVVKTLKLYSKIESDEKIMLSKHYYNGRKYVYAQVYNGSTWGNVIQLANYALPSEVTADNYDGTYLNNGNFMVFYIDNTSVVKSRTWNGSSWSSQQSLPNLGTNQIPTVIVSKNRPNTNEIMVAFVTSIEDTLTEYYSGSSWSSPTLHYTSVENTLMKSVDFSWDLDNPTKGALMYSGASNHKKLTVKIFTANGSGGGSFSSSDDSPASPPAIGGVTNVDLLNNSYFIGCNKDDDPNPQLACYRANQTPSWNNPANYLLSSVMPTGIQKSYDFGLEQTSTTTGIVVYSDNTSVPKLKKYNVQSDTFDNSPTTISTVGYSFGTLKLVRLVPIVGDDILILMGDSNNDLYSVFWKGSTNSIYTTPSSLAITRHGTNGSGSTETWFDFVY